MSKSISDIIIEVKELEIKSSYDQKAVQTLIDYLKTLEFNQNLNRIAEDNDYYAGKTVGMHDRIEWETQSKKTRQSLKYLKNKVDKQIHCNVNVDGDIRNIAFYILVNY